ncbi:MAG: Ig-like domain-containing protein, partial [Chitinispirillia bacterium]
MIKKLFPHIFACILLFLNMSFSQYPDTLWMPVTFYDYQTHPHAHNPDFEACLGAHSGMIHDTLSSLGKPILLKDYGCNDHVEEWFWPSAIGSNAQYNFVTHRYESGVVARPNPNEFVGVGYDSTYDMSNIVIYDSLPFIHLGNGLYEYVNYNFFPLDGIGYGEEGRTHNYGFAMELHTKFKYRPGITFFFRGDDDAWAFINGNLEMDLGGIHQQSVDGSVNVDTLGLATGQDYDFDFFYAERHTKNSSIRITTNIISTHLVTELTIEAVPSVAMLPAGDTISYTGTVWYDSTDANGVIHHKPDSILSQNITWSYSSNNHLSDPAKTSLLPTLGSQSIFTSTQAFEIFTITASYEDPITSEITTATAVITIVAGPPDHLVLEQIPDTTDIDILQSDQPLDTLIIEEYQSSRNAYAILRDQYGNFSNYSQNTDWTILSGSVLSSVASGSSALGEGVVTKYGSSGIGTISGQDLDSTGESYIDTCVVLVRNEAPTSTNDYYSTQEDVVLIVPGPGKANILDNDTDPDPLANLTAILVDDVSHGLLNLNADGSFTYMPPVDFNGTVQFTYKCYDNEFYSNVATVTIIVGVNNDPPTANNDNYSTNEDTPLNVTAPGLLSNDNDVDGDTLTAILVEAVDPLKGTLLLNSDGSFLFTPIAHFNGTATFTYQAFDGMVNSNLAAVTITVNPINDLPVANNDQYSTNEDNTLTVSSPGVLINDYDVDNDSLSDSIISNVSNGTLLLNPNGSFTYTPNANFNGNDSFTYLISDSYGTSNT